MTTYYLIAALVLLALIVIRQYRRVVKLEEKVHQLTMSLLQMIDESEAVNDELRQSLAEVGEPRKPASSAKAEFTLPKENIFEADEPWDLDRRHRVLTLARRGISAAEIARRLYLPDGEVELMLRMFRQTA